MRIDNPVCFTKTHKEKGAEIIEREKSSRKEWKKIPDSSLAEKDSCMEQGETGPESTMGKGPGVPNFQDKIVLQRQKIISVPRGGR